MSYFNTTLKRNSKLDLSRPDLLKLVSMLEGELQAREIVIAVLKSEQIKRLLNPSRSVPITISGFKATKQINLCTPKVQQELDADQTIKYSSDPLIALSRDSFAVYEPSLDYSTTLALYNIKIFQLENLIQSQRKLRTKINEQLKSLQSQYENLLKDLDKERRKNKIYETQYQDYDRVKLESKVHQLNQRLSETKDQVKQIILTLLNERKHLILKLIDEKHQNEELEQDLTSEKGKVAEMFEGLEDESKRSLQMEAELEKYLSDFEKERNEFKNQLQISEAKNIELMTEMERLRNTVEALQNQLAISSNTKIKDNIDQEKWNLGEGVRSSIVTTMPVGPKVHSLSSVNPVFHPKASVAQPITPNKNVTGAGSCSSASISKTIYQDTNPNTIILPPPSIPVPQPKQQQCSSATLKSLSSHPQNQNSCSNNAPLSTISGNNSINENENSCKSKSSAAKSDSSVKQTVMFYENSANQNKSTTANNATIISTTSPNITTTQATLSSSTIINKKPAPGPRPTPPPIPPNKPSIKPVLPIQAILSNKTNAANTTTNNNNNNKDSINVICKTTTNTTNSQTKVFNHNNSNNAQQQTISTVGKKS